MNTSKQKGSTMYRVSLYRKIIPIIMAGCLVILGIFLIKLLFSSSADKAAAVVQEFYEYEQAGNFSASWELFHPQMKERFSKGHYIQDRAHVFMNHFGVETFQLEIGSAEKVNNWKMTKDSAVFKKAYKVPITQAFKGKYGDFSIHQDVYTVKEDGEWTIMWDYKK